MILQVHWRTSLLAYSCFSNQTNSVSRNQTNLALKGIIGIEAMSVIASLAGDSDDKKNLTNYAHDYIEKWQILGITRNTTYPHTTLSYGSNESHGLCTTQCDSWPVLIVSRTPVQPLR